VIGGEEIKGDLLISVPINLDDVCVDLAQMVCVI
jgi:hypothetical protein